ncbi:unnamed protein product [Effrenium voratum]|uniref:Cyclic nucleotide-binding domain-containing protein n=1 Tax=Effrenium voratum TaxID=2562239 RepID=A0AA36NM47_9DINO|nr:unnamed protein product [Effrenium voratum]
MASFRELLRRLEDAHDLELAQLREELGQAGSRRKSTVAMNMDDFLNYSRGKEAPRRRLYENESPGSALNESATHEEDHHHLDRRSGSMASLGKRPTLELHPEWEDTGEEVVNPNAKPLLQRKSSIAEEGQALVESLSGGCCYRNAVFKPAVPLLIFWQLTGVMVLLFDTVWVPMQVFPEEAQISLSWLMSLTTIYWFGDIFVTLNTAIYSQRGEVDSRRVKIFCAYAKSWLFFDLLLTSLDLYSYVSKWLDPDAGGGGAAQAARSGRFARLVRLIRLLRLVRLAKLRQIMFVIASLIDSEWATLMFAVVRNLAVILISNHYLACIWFGIGTLVPDESAQCWVSRTGLEQADMWSQYMVSAQWALAQFTPGASEVNPECGVERLYYIFVLVCGLVLGSCFVSSITTIMNAVWGLTRYNTTQMFLLKKFLTEHGVSRQLSSRILRYVDYVMELRHKKTHQSKVHFLQLLSGPLQWELQREIFSNTLNVHNVFASYSMAASPAISQICATALSSNIYAKKDSVFHTGEQAKHMTFLVTGALVYCMKTTIDKKVVPLTIKLNASTWSCEAALWMMWRTRGDMRALAESDALVINSQKFREASMCYPASVTLGRAAAQQFYDRVMELSATSEIGMTDVSEEVMADHLHRNERQGDVLDIQRELEAAEEQEADSMGAVVWQKRVLHVSLFACISASGAARPSEKESLSIDSIGGGG